MITYLIIGATVLISMMAFNNGDLFHKLKHYPYAESRRGEYYRWISGGFLHGDYMHLIFNMITLYFFGPIVEHWFQSRFAGMGGLVYLLFYLISIGAASTGTFYRHKDNPQFASIGASGATAAVLFASILLNPLNEIYLFFIPWGIPGFIFGIFYLWYSSYESRRGRDNIDHLAHFYGAVFGFLFPLVLEPTLLRDFWLQIQLWAQDLF